MCRRIFSAAVLVFAVSLACSQAASAAVISFSYTGTVTPASSPGSNCALLQSGVPSAGPFNAGSPTGTDIVIGNLSVRDNTSTSDYTDTFAVPLGITVAVKDNASSTTKNFVFNSTLNGNVQGFGGIVATANFDNPFTTTSQTQDIGTNRYTVSINPSKAFAAPGSPTIGGTGSQGTYTFHIAAVPVPEPAMLSIFALAVPMMLARRRR